MPINIMRHCASGAGGGVPGPPGPVFGYGPDTTSRDGKKPKCWIHVRFGFSDDEGSVVFGF